MGVADGDRQRVGGIRRGRRRSPASSMRTIIATWSFCAAPVPVTDRLTRLAAYSVTGSPAWAAASRTTPRAWPSFSDEQRVAVDDRLLDRRLGRPVAREHRGQPVIERVQPHRQVVAGIAVRRHRRRRTGAASPSLDDAPAGVAQPGIEADQAHQPLRRCERRPPRPRNWRPPAARRRCRPAASSSLNRVSALSSSTGTVACGPSRAAPARAGRTSPPARRGRCSDRPARR